MARQQHEPQRTRDRSGQNKFRLRRVGKLFQRPERSQRRQSRAHRPQRGADLLVHGHRPLFLDQPCLRRRSAGGRDQGLGPACCSTILQPCVR